jgi:hypothetical protein
MVTRSAQECDVGCFAFHCEGSKIFPPPVSLAFPSRVPPRWQVSTSRVILNEEYPPTPLPMRMRNLSVVAFVQDDASYEVLQAVNVPVREDN